MCRHGNNRLCKTHLILQFPFSESLICLLTFTLEEVASFLRYCVALDNILVGAKKLGRSHFILAFFTFRLFHIPPDV